MLGDKVPEEGLRIFRIHPNEVFDRDVIVALGVYKDDLIKWLTSNNHIVSSELRARLENPNIYGLHIAYGPKRSLIYTRRFPRNARDHGALAHEIFHCVHAHLDHYNATPLVEGSTEETYAYAITRITEQIYEQIYSWEVGSGWYRDSSGTAKPLQATIHVPHNPNWREDGDKKVEAERRARYLTGDQMPSLRK